MNRLQRSAARWWRYSRYIVDEGRLRPASGAKLQSYDVWDRCFSAQSDRRPGQSPYESLGRLVRDLEDPYQPDYGATAEHHQKIAEWCGEYGLLGLLPEQALTIALAPRWQWEPDGCGEVSLEAERTSYVRTSTGWAGLRESAEDFAYPRTEITPVAPGANQGPRRIWEQRQEDQLVPQEYIPHWPAPGVVMQTLRKQTVESQTLGAGLGRFFPDVPPNEHETFTYPCPGTREFWEVYSEPLSDFIASPDLKVGRS